LLADGAIHKQRGVSAMSKHSVLSCTSLTAPLTGKDIDSAACSTACEPRCQCTTPCVHRCCIYRQAERSISNEQAQRAVVYKLDGSTYRQGHRQRCLQHSMRTALSMYTHLRTTLQQRGVSVMSKQSVQARTSIALPKDIDSAACSTA